MDEIIGGAGDDTISGDMDNDRIWGGDGSDVMDGGAGDDVLYGEAGNDVMSGDAGNDVFYGGSGDDIATGGAGDDLFVFGFGNDNDHFDGGVGWNDVIKLEGIDTGPTDGLWTLAVDDNIQWSEADAGLVFDEPASGQLELDDGSTLTFENISEIQWD